MTGVPEIYAKAMGYAISTGAENIKDIEGCHILVIDDHWTVAINGHNEITKAAPDGAMECSVPPYHVCVWWHGWIAGIVGPGGGEFAAGSGANEDSFIAAVDSAVVAN
jgi:hypothetical protein